MKYIIAIFISLFTFGLFGQTKIWTEDKLIEHWTSNGTDKIEGIYEDASFPYYKLGLIKEKNNYKLIFISVGSDNSDYKHWKEGDIKANLIPTATENMFKSKWYMADKDPTQRYIIKFDKGLMNLTTTSYARNSIYLKIYPIDNSLSRNETRLVSGTGFAISSDGIIVTNYHVIEGAETIKVRGFNESFNIGYNAEILVSDKINDLALIKIIDKSFLLLDSIPYIFKTDISKVGENVFVLGYPLRATMGDEIKLTNGIISSRTGFQGDITSYQISAPVQPGNSGGPLFNSQGNYIGIINAKHSQAENVSYAIKVSYLLNLLELLPDEPKLQTINLLEDKTLPVQVEMIKKFVYVIEVE